jgi:hypothetical protein
MEVSKGTFGFPDQTKFHQKGPESSPSKIIFSYNQDYYHNSNICNKCRCVLLYAAYIHAGASLCIPF